MTPNSVKLLYLIINETNEYTDEYNGDRYLALVHTDKGKDALKNIGNYGKSSNIFLDQQVIPQTIKIRNT